MRHLGLREWRDLFVQTASEWSEDKAPRLGAALAFYTALSMAPLLVISLRVAAIFFGDDAAAGEIERQAQAMMGQKGAEALQAMIENAHQENNGTLATVLGVLTLLVGASGVFGELQGSLNTIWEVQPKPGRGVWGFIKDRFLSFAMVMGCTFLLLVSLVVSTAITAATKFTEGFGEEFHWLGMLINFVVSFVVITGIFALTFKMVPDVKVAWRDVWIGAVITALLFVIGKFGIGIYLGRSSMASSYGVAGSLIVFLVWVYYSAQIVFFGAEFTQVYANRYGRRIVPSANAMPVTEEARAQQGLSSRGGMAPA
jgi:membrane protein